ncbi:ABC transporter substrate-binding protein [Burkholderia cepacia]|uniref:ABC transporter substrate-binding protein n=1 Tax=Burkholderia cepacia TaxID=292 RepID=A0AAX2RAG2_BURCE|nr:ABC transporter substrate-binding protein [Burkholderia cepacia]RQZ64194.1 ABC transporter substrate-binding protein [Burkholderia cepacia]TES63722.1 ABC transporter substrate-binding protein [Burkholderia cepacia]TES98291.1 ABC transporter substrate-binding protein [Burkholderia cepacia]TEU31560.1 ABC transporter substrate-binding protein [Burkholderia cepacia]TEU32744.1 ABC transporter substrate-binding protein [Burkholderia cepacia]
MNASFLTRTLAAAAFGAVALHASLAAAQSAPAAPAAPKRTLNVAIVPNYPPFEYKDPATDKLAGFDVDLGEALAAKMGVKLNWVETSFDQMMSSVATQRVDMIMSGMTDMPTRREVLTFVDYIETGPQFYTLKARAGEFAQMSALCGKRVGSSRRTSFPDNTAAWSEENCVKAGKPAIVVVGTDGSSDARMQLRQNRIDAAVQGGETLPYQNSLEQNAYAPVGKPFLSQYTGIGVAKTNAALTGALTTAFNQAIADGSYQKLLAKWGLQEHAVPKALVNGAH